MSPGGLIRLRDDLPNGAHGKRPGREEIEVGYVVDLVTLFGIQDCAKAEIPALQGKLSLR